ncbi:MAG: FMN-binding protein [Leifsonia sp.]|nr:FMN-binding protein [Leifsonia sp.]|tara:strand:- start:6001 stop:6468 length:468 start_codon:yes stop_codon:yes gene_type:complete
MSVRARVIGGLVSLGFLSVGWQLGAIEPLNPATTSTDDPTNGTAGAADASASTDAGTGSATVSDGTYTGSVESTRWGDVQVAVTISGGQITEVSTLQSPDAESRSIQLAANASPILAAEVISAQSSSVATVSGATFTSEAYLSSVQAALDEAAFS